MWTLLSLSVIFVTMTFFSGFIPIASSNNAFCALLFRRSNDNASEERAAGEYSVRRAID
jgi:hypothetical protein